MLLKVPEQVWPRELVKMSTENHHGNTVCKDNVLHRSRSWRHHRSFSHVTGSWSPYFMLSRTTTCTRCSSAVSERGVKYWKREAAPLSSNWYQYVDDYQFQHKNQTGSIIIMVTKWLVGAWTITRDSLRVPLSSTDTWATSSTSQCRGSIPGKALLKLSKSILNLCFG